MVGIVGGIVSAGLAGGAGAAQGYAQGQINTANQMTLQQNQAQLEEQKAQAAAQLQYNMANQARQDMVNRVQTAKQGIIDQNIQQLQQNPQQLQRYMPQAPQGMTDNQLSSWQQDAQSQALNTARQQMATDPRIQLQAGEQTGDVPMGTVAQMLHTDTQTQAMLQAWANRDHERLESAQMRAETMAQIAAGNQDTRLMVAQLAHSAAGGDKTALLVAKNMYDDASRNIEERRKELNDLSNQMTTAKSTEKPAIQQRIAQVQVEMQNLKQTHDYYASTVGSMLGVKPPPGIGGAGAPAPAPGPTPAPAAAPAASGLPAGWSLKVN
jgi:hypothetical protein